MGQNSSVLLYSYTIIFHLLFTHIHKYILTRILICFIYKLHELISILLTNENNLFYICWSYWTHYYMQRVDTNNWSGGVGTFYYNWGGDLFSFSCQIFYLSPHNPNWSSLNTLCHHCSTFSHVSWIAYSFYYNIIWLQHSSFSFI